MFIKNFKISASLLVLFSVAAGVLIFKIPSSIAANKSGTTHGDWKVACEKNTTTKKDVCFIQQSLSVTQDDKQVPLATYQFMYGEDKNLKLLEVLPQGILLQPGTSIIVGEKVLGNAKFTVCQNNTCLAVADVSKKDLDTILSGADVSIGMFNSEGKQTNLILSTKGLKEALNDIK